MPKSPSEKSGVSPASRWHNFSKESMNDREERYATLFDKLDINKDGTVCIEDLTESLRAMGLKDQTQAARVSSELEPVLLLVIIYR